MRSNEFIVNIIYIAKFIIRYKKNRNCRVIPSVGPNYLLKNYNLISKYFKNKKQNVNQTFALFERYILPGMVMWDDPLFLAYFPAGSSFVSILAEKQKHVFKKHSFAG